MEIKKLIISILIVSFLFLSACGGKEAEPAAEVQDDDLADMSPEEIASMLPERCMAYNPLACTDFSYDSSSNTLSIEIMNFDNAEITNVWIAVDKCGNSNENLGALQPNAESVFTFDCSSHEGDTIMSDVVYHYDTISGEHMDKTGSLKIKK